MGKSMWKVWGKRLTSKSEMVMPKHERKQSTGHKSTILASLFCFSGLFWPYWVWAKKCLCFKNQISKMNLIILTIKFVTPNYKFMLHMNQIFYIYFSFWTRKLCWSKVDLKRVFYNWVPVKNAFLVSCHRFQEINILPKQFCRTQKNLPVNAYE